MATKEQLEQLRSMIAPGKEEQAGSILKSVENEVMDLRESLSSANTESKNRKIKIRDMEKDIE